MKKIANFSSAAARKKTKQPDVNFFCCQKEKKFLTDISDLFCVLQKCIIICSLDFGLDSLPSSPILNSCLGIRLLLPILEKIEVCSEAGQKSNCSIVVTSQSLSVWSVSFAIGESHC